jgi:hypothetical protein
MYYKVKILFIDGGTQFSKLIKDVTHGKYSHSAIFMLGGLVEAVMPVVKVSPENKYDGYEQEIIEINILDLVAAENEARHLLGRLYGLSDCITGGLHDIAGIHLPGNGEITVDCSEAVTRILRAGGLDVFPGSPADDITPQDLYTALKKEWYR